MAAPEFTSSGITIQTFRQVFDELVTSLKGIYGSDINLDADSPDGQRVGILAKKLHDLQLYGQAMANNFDPDLANGVALERIIKLAGITKRAGTQSQWDLMVTVSQNLTLPNGYTLKDDDAQEWALESAAAVTTGANVVTFKSKLFAAIEGIAGSSFEQVTIVPGVTSIAAPANATKGADEETDEQLRQRRAKSLLNPSLSTIGRMQAALGSVAGVLDVIVYENDQDTFDATLSLDPHHIWVVIDGGAVADIAESMVKNKTAGCGTKGSTVQTYIETLTKPDLTTFDIEHVMRFDRPTNVPIYVNVDATPKISGDSIDSSAIAAAIAKSVPTIGEDLSASSLYEFGYDAGTNFHLENLQISDDNMVFIDGVLTSAANERYTIAVADVDVTVV